MEKNFLLAICLSFIILWGWSTLNPSTVKEPNLGEISQSLVTNEDVNFTSASVNAAQVEKSEKRAKAIERLQILEFDNLKVEFSNIGGVLNNVTLKQYDFSFPVKNIINVVGYEDYVFSLERMDEKSITYLYEDENCQITKVYFIPANDFIVKSEVEIFNKQEMSTLDRSKINNISLEMSTLDIVNKEKKVDARDKSLFEYVVSSSEKILRKNNAFKFSSKDEKMEHDTVNWLGFRNKYFCLLVKPQYDTEGYSINAIGKKQLNIITSGHGEDVSQGRGKKFSSLIYAGPEDLTMLKKYEVGFEGVQRYYKLGLFNIIAKFIYRIMNFIHRIIPNWGVCIILISILVYFSMYPLTLKGMMSMKRMQAIQPKIVALKEKHKNNPQKMNKEMIGIYKEHKVNPLGGCFPMLLQLPVFIGLFQVLSRSVAFKGAGFLWIKDLSEPDRLFLLPFHLPIIANEVNLLPILMTIIMFFQQKLSAKNMVIMDAAQATQQKMMSTIFPVFLGVIFYRFASGLSLYFTMFYLFSAFTQWKMSQGTKAA